MIILEGELNQFHYCSYIGALTSTIAVIIIMHLFGLLL